MKRLLQPFGTLFLSASLAFGLAPLSAQEAPLDASGDIAMTSPLAGSFGMAPQRGQSSRGSSTRGSSSRGSQSSRGSSSRGSSSRGSASRGSSSRSSGARSSGSRSSGVRSTGSRSSGSRSFGGSRSTGSTRSSGATRSTGSTRGSRSTGSTRSSGSTRSIPNYGSSRSTGSRSSGTRSTGTSGARTPGSTYTTSNPGLYRARPATPSTRGSSRASGEAVAPRGGTSSTTIYRGRADTSVRSKGTTSTAPAPTAPAGTSGTRQPLTSSGSSFPRAYRPPLERRPGRPTVAGPRGIDIYRGTTNRGSGTKSSTSPNKSSLSSGRLNAGQHLKSRPGASLGTRGTSSVASPKGASPVGKGAKGLGTRGTKGVGTGTKGVTKKNPTLGDLAKSSPKKLAGAAAIADRILASPDASLGLGTGKSSIRPTTYGGRSLTAPGFGFGQPNYNPYLNWGWGLGWDCWWNSYWGWTPTCWWNWGLGFVGWNTWWNTWWCPQYYVPYQTTRVVYETVYVDEQVLQPADFVGEGVVDPVAPAAVGRVATPTLSLAAERYLTLGDVAFREGRYTDAVQAYSKAVEYAPGQGALFLLLADALFASGDYHYAAYAIRRAYELEPDLFRTVIDKHAFYGDPLDYDRQIAILEQFLTDRPTDRDARLVLALNYLFANRPATAVDLLRKDASQSLIGEAVAQQILETADYAQFGRSLPPSGEVPLK